MLFRSMPSVTVDVRGFGTTSSSIVAMETGEAPTAGIVTADEAVRVGPNPTRGAATFTFGLAADSDVAISLYDVRGREVAVVAEGPMTAGTQRVSLSEDLPAGVYVWRMVAGDRVETGRMTVVR